MKRFNKILAVALLAIAITFGLSLAIKAATTVNLGTADDFAVLAGSTITNTGASVITGDLGLSPGTSVTGFPPGTFTGTQHVANATAVQAKTDLTTAYNDAAGQTSTVVATELGGTTKTAGAYSSADGTFGITGTLTLDAQGDPDAVFIFKTSSTLITASGSNVVLANGAQACHVFWQVGSSATLGTNSTFRGNVLALTSITLNTGASAEGRMLARNGAVTLDTNNITTAVCAVSPTPATLHVIKRVVNNNGGTAVPSDFNMHVKRSGVDVSGSPADGTSAPGTSYSLSAGTYVVSEDAYPSYTQSISGDCDSSGNVTLVAGDDKTCTITNTDIADADDTTTDDADTTDTDDITTDDADTTDTDDTGTTTDTTETDTDDTGTTTTTDATTDSSTLTPDFPKTGLFSERRNNLLGIVIPVSVLISVSTLIVLVLRKRKI